MGRKNSSKGIIIFISVLAAAAAVLAAVLLITLSKGDGQEEGILNGTYDGQAADKAEVTIVHTGKQDKAGDPGMREIDFEGLRAANKDVCAWIYIPDADIDCAVVTDDDDPEYYLSNGIEGLNGVFMQSYNRKDFTDRMTVVYGKKNADGKSPFEGLFRFQDTDFYKGHKYIYVYTPDGMRKYRIFAAHRAVANHLMLGYDWDVDQIYLDYLIGVLESREMGDNIDRDVEITVEDKVLTLSERVSDDENVRFLVQGVYER